MPAGAESNSQNGSFMELSETEESLNTNAVGQTADINSKARKGSTRGRKPRSVSSQSNTMLTMGWASSKKKRSRSARRDSSDEELCEESKSQRMTKITPKKKMSPEKGKLSPEQRNEYGKFVSSLKENRKMSKQRASEYAKLLTLTDKQSKLYREVEKALKAGEELDMDRLTVLTQMYDKVGNRCHKRLNSLADTANTECKAITYESSSSCSSSDSSPNTTVDEDERKAGNP